MGLSIANESKGELVWVSFIHHASGGNTKKTRVYPNMDDSLMNRILDGFKNLSRLFKGSGVFSRTTQERILHLGLPFCFASHLI